MNRRALGVAIVLAVLGMCLMLLYQRRFEEEASGGDRVKVLTLQKRIERGTAIEESMLTTRQIPLAYVDERAVKEAEKEKILRLAVVNTIPEQSILMWPDVVSSGEERRDVSRLVLPGYRAVTIRVNHSDSSTALIRPGDYVDVIGVLGAANTETKTAAVLLQRVLVLAAGMETSPDRDDIKKDGRNDDALTLSLNLQEAQVLAVASEKGHLTVAIRRPDDNNTTVRLPDLASDAILNPSWMPGSWFVPTSTAPVDIGKPGERR